MVKSVYLSIGRYPDGDERQREYAQTLTEIADQIRRGTEPQFEHDELERLRAEREFVRSVPARAVWGAVAQFFLPAVIVIGVLLAVLWILRAFRP